MGAPACEAPLVNHYGRRLELGATPSGIVWQGTAALVALGDGSVAHVADDGTVTRTAAHDGAILAACRDPRGPAIMTGGDDGRVCRVGLDGTVREIGRFGGRWVGHLVASPTSGLLVAGVGREAVVWAAGTDAPSHGFALTSTIGGLALDAKGKRLAVTGYGGPTLLYAGSARSGRLELRWAGSHLACTLSPDGRYLVTALQETGLHGWMLAEGRDMGMTGYRTKTRSFAWDRRGRWLATGGDVQAILWPFEGKTGPMGKAPLLRAGRGDAIVTRVAFHPRDDMLAVGYDDGAVVLARSADEQVLAVNGLGAPLAVLGWNEAGTRLAWGGEDGTVGVLDMEARA